MNEADLRALVDQIGAGQVSADEAVERLRRLPFVDAGDALIDLHRGVRQGLAEVVYAPGKRIDQCVTIVGQLLADTSGAVLATRTNDDQAAALHAAHPGATQVGSTIAWQLPAPRSMTPVAVVSAGTSDLSVVEEAALTLAAYAIPTVSIVDVGVAGLHRLLAHLDPITAAPAVIVVAGMEGALASVVGGLTAAPVVAVPTSVGYGSSLEGVTALLAMHASCASGITVVGIDNGFGAACAVARMLR
ncbi:MAG TPA: nickel pincer cofactor biosynthesis protein LarB [Ilumatobacteraceae bacterium]|nr:nickel pincer cofactor biosynthesis protein LarB [Ilumatobacteraceae bacterium]